MSGALNTLGDSETVENSGNEDDFDGGVKALNHRTNEEVKEMLRESIRKQREEYVSDEFEIQKLSEEFSDILKPYVPQEMNVA